MEWIPVCIILLYCSIVDIRQHVIPIRMIIISFIWRAVWYGYLYVYRIDFYINLQRSFSQCLFWGGVFLLCFFILYCIYKGSIGLGDVLFIGVLAMYVKPLDYIEVLTVAFFLTVIVALFKKGEKRKQKIAFIPGITIAMIGYVIGYMMTGKS